MLSNEQCNCQQYKADACFVQENHTAKYCSVDYILGDIRSAVQTYILGIRCCVKLGEISQENPPHVWCNLFHRNNQDKYVQ